MRQNDSKLTGARGIYQNLVYHAISYESSHCASIRPSDTLGRPNDRSPLLLYGSPISYDSCIAPDDA